MWCGYQVETMLVRRDDVSQSERLLVSGGVLQHTEQQETEPRQAKRAQQRHLVAALRILLRVLERSQIKDNHHLVPNFNLIEKFNLKSSLIDLFLYLTY